MKFRVATRHDVPDIQRVRHSVQENRLAATVISDQDVVRAVEETGRGWVAESGGSIIGFSIANGQSGTVWALFVEPDHEGKGIGSGLLDRAVEWLFKIGHDHVSLSTDPQTRAENFYRSRGWQEQSKKENGEIIFQLQRRSSL